MAGMKQTFMDDDRPEIVKPEGHTNRPNKTQIRLIFAKIHLPGMLSICCV
jgi:hypothetical protein